MRTGENGWERLAIGQKDLSRLPPRVLLPGGERPAPTEAGAETGAAERHWRSLTPRHALRRAQPCLVAESLCALTKNREVSICLPLYFWQGQKDLNPRHAVLEWMWEHTSKSGRKAVLPGSRRKSQTGGAGLVLRGKTQLPRALRGLEKALCISFLTKS